MQLYPNKIDTTLVSSFVARNTRFNSCFYLYCYNILIVPRRRGQKYQDLTKHNIMIELPRDLPTGRDPREPPIYRASDVPNRNPNCPSNPPTNRFPRRRTKPVSITVSQSNLQSLSRWISREKSRSTD